MEPIDENVEAERLRHVRALIEDVLKEHGVCAQVILAGRAGRFENFTDIRASWSCVRLVETEDGRSGIGVRSTLAEFAGDKERQKQELGWSLGMVSGFGEIGGHMAISWLEASDVLSMATQAEHTPLRRDDPRDEP
jgi:hypothetical protein